METSGGITYCLVLAFILTMAIERTTAQNDFSGPISCYYCFGPAENSSCADPVNPREESGKTLEVITCEHGICLKWTHYWNKVLYMHRTCSQRLESFRIMMIDGVCRSERTGNGYLCMCGKHLCNSSVRNIISYNVFITCLVFVTAFLKGPTSLQRV